MSTKEADKAAGAVSALYVAGTGWQRIFGEAWRLAEGKELGDKIMSHDGYCPGGVCESAAQPASA